MSPSRHVLRYLKTIVKYIENPPYNLKHSIKLSKS